MTPPPVLDLPPADAVVIVVDLPRAPRALSPNKRGSTKSGSGARALYRDSCNVLVKAAVQEWRRANPMRQD